MSATSRAAWGNSGQNVTSGNISSKKQTKLEFEENKNLDKGCWMRCSSCIGGMWTTRQMTKGGDREIYVKTTIRELIVYIIFLIILCILTFGMVSPTMYYYTKVLSDLFLDAPYPDTKNTLRGSTQVMDFWRFVESVMLDGLYWEYWYDIDKTPTADPEDRKILYENYIITIPRMRMIRVGNNSCTVAPDFAKVIRQCFSVYSQSSEDTNPIITTENGTAWVYQLSDVLGSSSHWGKLGTYSGSGYVQDLKGEKELARKQLESLRKNLWIQRGTRAVFIDFTVYNANINLFCVIKLLFEFPATGGIVPSWSFLTVKLLKYVSPYDYFILACECIFIFFIVYYIIEESLEIKQIKWKYFKSMWNILDLLVIGLSLLCIGFSAYTSLTVSDKLESLLAEPDKFANFENLGYFQMQYNSAVAICVFFAVFKLFKYISFNKTMTQLSSTISRCSKDLAGFAIMFFIVFFAFAQLGYLLFGTQVEDFSTFINAGFTLLRTILGDFNFHDIEEANRVLGPLFFLCYVFFVFFVLLNMFLAIINDTYSEVKAEIANQKNEFEIADYFKRGLNNMWGKVGKRDRLVDIEEALKTSDVDNNGIYSVDEIRTRFKKYNFSDTEINMFLCKYDLNEDSEISSDHIKIMLNDLKGEPVEIDFAQKGNVQSDLSTDGGGDALAVGPLSAGAMTGDTSNNVTVNYEEFGVMQRRVDRLEHSIGSIVSKIDAVLVKLDTMEKSKSKRKDQMSMILETITENDGSDDHTKRRQMEKLVRDEIDDLDDH